MSKKSVAVVMGGFSDEYEVSLKSGQLIFDSLDRSLYEVYKVHILKEGWFFVDENGQRYPIDKSDFSATLPSGASIKFDVCFNTIHGTPGENGLMQGYWDMIGQRYTGCSFYASALTFNKKDTLAVLSKYDIPSAKSVYIRRGDCYNEDDIVKELGLPLFVKPNQSGSSLGASKVNEKIELNAAIERAFEQDDDVLIEAFLEGTEVSVGVLDYQGETIVLGITEIVSENEFFDFDAKYNGESQEITPARLDDSTKEKVECIAKRAYKALNMSGFSRSEFIIIDGVPYMLEMNTNPGFSPASILPQQAGIYGISIKDLCGNEVEKALAKNNKH